MARMAAFALILLACGPSSAAEPAAAGAPGALSAIAVDAAARGQTAKALSYARRAAESGDGAALAVLAEFHEIGIGIPRDRPAAAKLYRRAIEAGFSPAAARLGFLHLSGIGVTQDSALARHWFRHFALLLQRMADREGFIADWMAGRGVPKALQVAVEWADRVRASDAAERYALSRKYRAGDGVPKDDAMAAYLLARVFYQGIPAADFDYGLALLSEFPGRAKIALGLDLLHSAAEAGYAEAQKTLAMRHLAGRDVKKSDVAAMFWLRRAKDGGAEVGRALYELDQYISDADRARAEWRLRNNYVPDVD